MCSIRHANLTHCMMEIAYVCEWEKRPKSNNCPSIPLVCAWSCRNLIAFTSDLKNDEDDKDLSHMIHIIDTDHPWDVYSINSGHTEVISCLEWDQSGSRLLSADGEGQIKCWGMTEHLVNSWECTQSTSVDGDPIIALSWLHNGVKLALHVEKRSFPGGGNIVVAATDGSSSSPVQFYKVCVSVVNEKCRIDTELLPSLFMGCTTDPGRRDKYPAVTHLKFLTRENSEQVLLCASSQMGSIVECWSLRKEGLPVNNIFQHRSPVVGEKQPMILKWRILSATNDLERVSAVALPKLPISISNTDLKVVSDTKFFPGLGLALAFHDGSIQILHRLSLHTMGVFYSSSGSSQRVGEEPAIKRQRAGGPTLHFRALQFSWTSLALVGVDNHGKPSMVHNLLEKLHEEYMRQNQALQQVLSTRIVAVKASLCKLSSATAARACDFHAKLLLIAISSTLKSLLRPHVLNTPDKSPGDRVSEICAKNTDTDIDKVMINLKTEEFVLDGPPLQSFQQLIQWVGDFVLYLLANLPNQGSIVRPGFGFLQDGASLGMLREMLVMIRIWGLLKPGCLPIYTATSDNQDSMFLLFCLLTKLWLCSRDESHPQDPDETLIDECCLLPSQLLVPSMDWLPINDGIITKIQSKHQLRLQFGKPYTLPGVNPNAQVEVFRSPASQRMDHLRCLHLGISPTEDSKACTRCGCVTMLRSPNKTSAMRQWEQRWIKNCLCGGLWRRIPSTLT
uniref:Mediator of RNA polymerase II transcription subunit 16 n=1 Tax=Cyprinus carpio TaxID=7962 RepID=A0A8C2C535_CYPCA